MKSVTRRRLRLGAIALTTAGLLGTLAIGIASADPLATQSRVSVQGPGDGTGNAAFDATEPSVAYNLKRNNYLSVWRGPTAASSSDFEIWARIVGADGAPTGPVIRVSNMGGPNDPAYDAGIEPKVAYNSAADEYLVVWYGDHNANGLLDDEEEIHGRRIKGDGTYASDQFQISFMGVNGSTTYEGYQPDVVYNPDLDQYVVAWYGDDPSHGNANAEIWLRRLAPDGSSIDADDVRVTDASNAVPGQLVARDPSLAYDPDAKQYLVVYESDEIANNDFEIHGQRLGQGLGELGANDFQISETPGAGGAFNPAVAYNSAAKRFMTVWRAGKIAAGENEIYGQLHDASGAPVGTDDFRVSTSGPDGNPAYDAEGPGITANGRANEFLVAWRGDDDQPGLLVNADEVFAQRYTGAGVAVGTPEVRVSTMGPDDDANFDASGSVSGAYNSTDNEYLLTWKGDDNTGGLLNGEDEVYVRRHGAGTATEPFPENCKPVPPRGTPNEVQLPSEITAGYLKTNQKTGAATVRRANAVGTWFDAGLEDKDLCGGSLAPADLGPNLTATSGPLGPQPPQADPRPVSIPPAKPSNATFTANAEQMCINQRIYQAGIARANALKARLAGELTGGDLKDGTLTQGKLRQDLTVTAAVVNPSPPAASKTDVKAPTRAGCDKVKFTTAQAAINRRIAIASVVRINEALDEIAGGLKSGNFKDATITKADFAAGVTP